MRQPKAALHGLYATQKKFFINHDLIKKAKTCPKVTFALTALHRSMAQRSSREVKLPWQTRSRIHQKAPHALGRTKAIGNSCSSICGAAIRHYPRDLVHKLAVLHVRRK
jgi:hypothetical protein